MEVDSAQRDQQFLAPVLGSEAELLISLNQKLSQLKIENTIKLSSIVVIGDQSTGKSSLIERISNVKVPKASGLCTRCPIAINLSSGQAWKCAVWIEEPYLYNTSVNARITKTRQMGPWELKPEATSQFVGETYDESMLIDLIQEAQNLILNPTRNQQSGEDPFDQRLELFSPNVIRLDISVGECPNLSFIDMPGCISSLGKDQPSYYVELVSNLASKAARDEKNIVLLVLPSNHDSSNSRSYGIIQKQAAQSHTMAVYTKVDVAREEELRDLLAKQFGEEEEEFEHGNHVVMLRDSVGSAADVAIAEENFFSQPPWSNLPETTRNRLGVTNLVELLRQILFQKTAEALPSYVQQIRTRITKVSNELSAMPAPPDTSEIPNQLNGLMSRFEHKVGQLFASNQSDTSIVSRSELTKLMADFKEQIQSDSPKLTFRTGFEQEQYDEAKDQIDDQVSASETPGSSSAKKKIKTTQESSEEPLRGTYKFTLDEIEDLNKKYQSTSVPGDIEPRAIEAMNLLSVQAWNGTFRQHMVEVSKVLHSQVLRCIRETFSIHKSLPIYKKIQEFAGKYLDRIVKNEQTRLQYFCESETTHPLCSDDKRLKTVEGEEYEDMRTKRDRDRLSVEKMIQNSKGNPTNKKKSNNLTVESLGPDPWDTELRMAAKTSAYYQVVSVRFVDHVCQHIWAHLVPQIRNGDLVNHIRLNLGLDDHNNPQAQAQLILWMTENPEIERLRSKRQTELEKLQAGFAHISEVSKKLKQHGPSQTHDAYENEQTYQSTLSGDGLTPSRGASDHISPNKRRITEADFDDDEEQDHLRTPSKRAKATRRGEDGRQVRLPSRGPSVEAMDEDE